MKRKRNFQPKEHDKHPTNKTGDRESTWQRIKNNDSKDDSKSWKQSGVTDKQTRDEDWEDARNV